MKIRQSIVVLAAVMACFGARVGVSQADVADLQKGFQTPPDDARIMVRWWWYGPAVTKEGIEKELKTMKAGGIGGVEVQCTYPLTVEGAEAKTLKLLSPEHLEMLKFTAAKCKELGLRMDLTLGSGWPYGGPNFGPDEGAGQLETQVVNVSGGAKTVPLPNLRPGRKVFAAFAGKTEIPIDGTAVKVPDGFAGGPVTLFISGRTGMQVKRPAVGGEGNVIDHLSAKVVDKFISEVAEPAIAACGENPPYAIFCDSLEVGGENWTDDFLAEFKTRRGYDLRPHLPDLVGEATTENAPVRHDYARTVTDIFNDNFNAKFKALAAKHGSRYRLQGYGSPPAGLYSYLTTDLPEGEGGGNGNWKTFRTTRYAASASHLMGQKVTSSETFTWLHSAAFRAVPIDMKGEADTHFLDGINQIICHGWPYTPAGLSYPGGSFYAAAVFDEKNPWYVAMPEITGYLQRVSHILREGNPANDVAVYLPDSDVWAKAGPKYSSLNASHTQNSSIVAALTDAGYNLDGWDDGMLAAKGKAEGGALAFGEVKYKVVVLPWVTHLPIETARAMKAFVDEGGMLFAVGYTPTKVPGLEAKPAEQEELAGIMKGLFEGGKAVLVKDETELAGVIAKKLAPDVKIEGGVGIGSVHRHTADGEVYFVANTGDSRQTVRATFRVEGLNPEMWDPLTGKVTAIPVVAKGNGTSTVELTFEPLGSTVVVWSSRVMPAMDASVPAAGSQDLSAGWSLKFGEKIVKLDSLKSWTELEGMKNYSGVGVYERTVNATAGMAGEGARTYLDLGETTALPAQAGRRASGYVANVTTPVRDAAVVYVNGKRAGAAWCAPYRVEIGSLLKEGENSIRIEVGNTAVNYIAEHGFPNYDLAALRQAYGNRFDPQNMNLASQPLPSGLLGPVKLVWGGK